MNLFVLSELHPENKHVGWAVSYTLERTLENACNATFLYPLSNDRIGILKRYRHRIFRSWFEIQDLPVLGSGINVLLIVGILPRFLLSMHALGPLLKKFDLRIGYLLDGFKPDHIDRTVFSELDQLFVISAEIADEINSSSPVSAAFLPLATDTFRVTSNARYRSIDIISYGRTNRAVHECLQTHYMESESDRTYFYSTFSKPDVYDLEEHITLLSNLLGRSKISLCFEASNIERFCGYSPILFRWFEGWNAGCNIVGRKPFGKNVTPLMDWENSTLELPDDRTEWIAFFEDLLENQKLLEANSRRNRLECLARHDWRYRISDMFNSVNLPIPESLNTDLLRLKHRIEEQKTVLI